jgi:tripartite-type tricarboxylate transporter receptor subunit TctC
MASSKPVTGTALEIRVHNVTMTNSSMRHIMSVVPFGIGVALSLAGFAGALHAQPYPARPIQFIVTSNPGGVGDAVARLIGQKLSERWGVAVPVEGRPGASGLVAGSIVAKAHPDGHTLAIFASGHVLHPSMYREVPFDPINDFTQIIMAVRSANVICVHPSVPVKSIKELVELARARPGELFFSSAGLGNSSHLSGEMFKMAANIEIQNVSYKGGGPAMAALVGGEVAIGVSSTLAAVPFVKAGRIRALAVTGTKRQAILPDVPTMAESGYPDFEANEWWGIVGPAGLPKDIVAKLNAEIDRIMKLPDVQEKIATMGLEYIGGSPEQATAFMKYEAEKLTKVVKAAGLKPE